MDILGRLIWLHAVCVHLRSRSCWTVPCSQACQLWRERARRVPRTHISEHQISWCAFWTAHAWKRSPGIPAVLCWVLARSRPEAAAGFTLAHELHSSSKPASRRDVFWHLSYVTTQSVPRALCHNGLLLSLWPSKQALPCPIQARKRAGCINLKAEPLDRDISARNINVVEDKDTASLGPQQYVISCVKGNQLSSSLPQLQPLVGQDTTLIVLQVRCRS